MKVILYVYNLSDRNFMVNEPIDVVFADESKVGLAIIYNDPSFKIASAIKTVEQSF